MERILLKISDFPQMKVISIVCAKLYRRSGFDREILMIANY